MTSSPPLTDAASGFSTTSRLSANSRQRSPVLPRISLFLKPRCVFAGTLTPTHLFRPTSLPEKIRQTAQSSTTTSLEITPRLSRWKFATRKEQSCASSPAAIPYRPPILCSPFLVTGSVRHSHSLQLPACTASCGTCITLPCLASSPAIPSLLSRTTLLPIRPLRGSIRRSTQSYSPPAARATLSL